VEDMQSPPVNSKGAVHIDGGLPTITVGVVSEPPLSRHRIAAPSCWRPV
jgi:hypothetical protein